LANVGDCYWASSGARVPEDLVDVKLWVDYIYLDTDERRRFAQASHEYLIEQLQFNGDMPINSSIEQLKMAFNHPVKEVIWTIQKDSIIDPVVMKTYGGQQWFNFTDSIDYSYFSGTPQDPLGGGIGTAAFNVGNWYSSLPISGTANGSIATSGHYGQNGSNIAVLNFNDLFGDGNISPSTSLGWTSQLPVFDSGENPTALAKIQLNGHDRLSQREGRYFNTVIPQECHENCPAMGINVYSFAFKPEEHQPSGTCNFSRIDIAQLLLNITSATYLTNSGSPDTAKCRIYATNYNVLRVLSGMAGLAFTN
jgi:hypothetical protein